jgi:hypothetical protein
VEVNNVPDDCKEWIVARWSPESRGLWFWGSWDNKAQAEEIAKFLKGIVVRRTENGTV